MIVGRSGGRKLSVWLWKNKTDVSDQRQGRRIPFNQQLLHFFPFWHSTGWIRPTPILKISLFVYLFIYSFVDSFTFYLFFICLFIYLSFIYAFSGLLTCFLFVHFSLCVFIVCVCHASMWYDMWVYNSCTYAFVQCGIYVYCV